MTVFISRDLAPDSDFQRLLIERGWPVSGQSLVVLTALPFETIPPADWIFFTSQQAVRFFFRQLQEQGIAQPAAKWAVLGTVTAKVLAEYVGSVDFVGTGEPESTAAGFRTVAQRGSILFPSARHATHTLRTLLSPDFPCLHFEIYDNQPVLNPPFRVDDVLVFTSPLNAAAYFAKHRLQEMQRVVAIGGTTAAALSGWGISEIIVATEPTEAGLAEAVLKTG